MSLHMALHLPVIYAAVLQEKKTIRHLIEKYKIDLVISDNRFGCYSKNIPSVFITHQINIKTPRLSKWVNKLNQKTIKIIPFLICTFSLLLSSPLWAIEDGILAVVNDEVITHRDLQEYINATYVSLATQGYSQDKLDEVMQDMQKNGLTKLIEDKLILSRAKELGMTINE